MMDEKNLNRMYKDIKWFSVIILIGLAIILLIEVISGSMSPSLIIIILIQMILLSLTIEGCINKKIYGPIAGIIVAITMTIFLTLVSFLIGTILFIECVVLIKNIKKSK